MTHSDVEKLEKPDVEDWTTETFQECMCNLDWNGKLDSESYHTCISFIASGRMDVNTLCNVKGRFNGYNLLAIVMTTGEMDRVLELLKLGANGMVRPAFCLRFLDSVEEY